MKLQEYIKGINKEWLNFINLVKIYMLVLKMWKIKVNNMFQLVTMKLEL